MLFAVNQENTVIYYISAGNVPQAYEILFSSLIKSGGTYQELSKYSFSIRTVYRDEVKMLEDILNVKKEKFEKRKVLACTGVQVVSEFEIGKFKQG